MRKMEIYIGIDFTTKKSSEATKEGIKDTRQNIKEILIDMANEYMEFKKPIIGKITIEYGDENYWKTINKIRNEKNQ